MKLRVVLTASCALVALPSAIAQTPQTQQSVAVTSYPDDLALVQDRRQVDFQGGRQRLQFDGVSAQIRAETASLSTTGITIAEQNFDFDLLTPTKMMEKAVGSTVTIIRVNPATG